MNLRTNSSHGRTAQLLAGPAVCAARFSHVHRSPGHFDLRGGDERDWTTRPRALTWVVVRAGSTRVGPKRSRCASKTNPPVRARKPHCPSGPGVFPLRTDTAADETNPTRSIGLWRQE